MLPRADTAVSEGAAERGEQAAVQNAIPNDAGRRAEFLNDQVELTYAQTSAEGQGETASADPKANASDRTEPSGFKNLPSWAQDMFRRTGGFPEDGFSGQNTVQFDATKIGPRSAGAPLGYRGAGQIPHGDGRQIIWSAPGMSMSVPSASTSLPPSPSPQMVFRDRESGTEPQNGQNRAMNEREIRKTADKVYRLIEERLRKELRRGGK